MDPVNKAVLDALVALHANMLAQDLDNQAERPTEEEFQACMAAASAAIRAATEEGAPAPADPMDWPLPCDVVIGHITMRKGLKLSALVKPMQVLYEMTEGASLAAQAEPAVAMPAVTEKMRAAGDCAWMTSDCVDSARVFLAMLAAAPQPQAEVPATPWPIAPDVAAELERSDWTPEEALRWYAAGRHYDTVPNGDGSSSARILDNGAVASNALKSLSREYAEHKGDIALQEPPAPAQEPPPIHALMCVISSLRDTAHFSDEEGEVTNDLRRLRDWIFERAAAPHPAPSAQGDAVLAYLDGLSDDAAAHIFPDDLRRCSTSECTATVYSVRVGSPDGKTVPLYSREQVAAAIAAQKGRAA